MDRYRKNYSNKEQMGTLRFEIEQVDLLGSKYANVVGRFFPGAKRSSRRRFLRRLHAAV